MHIPVKAFDHIGIGRGIDHMLLLFQPVDQRVQLLKKFRLHGPTGVGRRNRVVDTVHAGQFTHGKVVDPPYLERFIEVFIEDVIDPVQTDTAHQHNHHHRHPQ